MIVSQNSPFHHVVAILLYVDRGVRTQTCPRASIIDSAKSEILKLPLSFIKEVLFNIELPLLSINDVMFDIFKN
jgi:hypothetical protein